MNPLLYVLKESRTIGDTPHEALQKLIFLINSYLDQPVNVLEEHNICVGWIVENGEPTYERLRAWVEEFAGADEHRGVMHRLQEAHDAVWASLTDDERREAFGDHPDAPT